MVYNLIGLDEQNTEALCFSKAAVLHFSQLDFVGKVPSMCGLTSSAVRLGNGSTRGGHFAMGRYKTEKRICVICGGEFDAAMQAGRKTCSETCRKRLYLNRPLTMMKRCEVCGHEFLTPHYGRKYCSEECRRVKSKQYSRRTKRKQYIVHKQKPVVLPLNCVWCGIGFIPDRQHPNQKFCSEKHRNQFHHKKQRAIRTQKEREDREKIACGICGNMFVPTKDHHRYCTDKCSAKAYKAGKKREYKARAEKAKQKTEGVRKICQYCGVAYSSGGSKYCCDDHRFAAWWGYERPNKTPKLCEWCGKEFETSRPNQTCCCSEHGKKVSNQRRRATLKRVIHSHYSRWDVFERDNFICHICGHVIDMDAVAPALYSPTIDHVIPLAKGGYDTIENVKAAHFICNSKKSDSHVCTRAVNNVL
jgi:hypothetical protein